MKKVIELKWGKEGATHQLRGGWPQWYASIREVDGGWQWSSQTEDGTPRATLDEAKAAAEASLGVQAVPAVLLRWVEQDDGGAKLTLGDVSIAEVYTPIDDADAVWYAESEHRIAPRHADFPDRTAAMRAVEQAFGIAAPLPVEGE